METGEFVTIIAAIGIVIVIIVAGMCQCERISVLLQLEAFERQQRDDEMRERLDRLLGKEREGP